MHLCKVCAVDGEFMISIAVKVKDSYYARAIALDAVYTVNEAISLFPTSLRVYVSQIHTLLLHYAW